MKTFFTSDLHADHRNIIAYCNRPFKDVDHMRRVLIDNWNTAVGPRDMVYVLGDFVMGKADYAERMLKSLNGTKYLIRGNHDKGSTEKLEAAGFRWVGTGLQYQLGPHLVTLSHYPYAADPEEERVNQRSDGVTYVDKFASRRPKDTGGWLLHGHVHTAWQVKGRQVNVGVDRWNYSPVSQEELLEVIDGQTKSSS